MSNAVEPAADCWEVERQTCGNMHRPYCVVILRNKKKPRESVVKASSSDFLSMCEYADQLGKDLQALGNEEFMDKYQLSSTA